MGILLDRECVVFDLETTDIGVAHAAGGCGLPSIVEIGAVRVSTDLEVLETYSSLVRPPNLSAFTPFCQSLTGIKVEELEAASEWPDVWRGFAEFTNFNATRLVAWHASFDTAVLRAAYVRNRLGFPHSVTPFCAASMLYGIFAAWGISCPSWSLKKACSQFDVEIKDAHRALGDARATADLLRAVSDYLDYLEGESHGGTT